MSTSDIATPLEINNDLIIGLILRIDKWNPPRQIVDLPNHTTGGYTSNTKINNNTYEFDINIIRQRKSAPPGLLEANIYTESNNNMFVAYNLIINTSANKYNAKGQIDNAINALQIEKHILSHLPLSGEHDKIRQEISDFINNTPI